MEDPRAREAEKFTQEVIAWFNHAWYFNKAQTWENMSWMGVPIYKCPTDMWVYQEILFQTRPTLVFETGTANGGSALFFAQIGELMGGVRVVTVDLNNEKLAAKLPRHQNISYLSGSSTDEQVLAKVRESVRPADRVMVVLDSDHSEAHVRAELERYAALVTPGCYLIVEDTNVNGHPVYPMHGPGPMEAVRGWIGAHPEFEMDRQREKFMLTFNPGGYLRRR